MNRKVTNFTHPGETVDDASQSYFNPSVPKQSKFLKGKRKEKPGFRGSCGSLSLTPASPLPNTQTREPGWHGGRPSGPGSPFAGGLHGGPGSGLGADAHAADFLSAPGRGRVYSAPGPARRPHGRLRPGRGPRTARPPPPAPAPASRAGLPDTHRPARPNRGPDPGCRGRRARLLPAVPAPLRAPHPRATRLLLASLPSRAAAFSLPRSSSSSSCSSSACSPGGGPPHPPHPAQLCPAHPAGPRGPWQAGRRRARRTRRRRSRRARRGRARRPPTLPRLPGRAVTESRVQRSVVSAPPRRGFPPDPTWLLPSRSTKSCSILGCCIPEKNPRQRSFGNEENRPKKSDLFNSLNGRRSSPNPLTLGASVFPLGHI